MTHASCPDCWLRFTRAAAAEDRNCPLCGRLLELDTAAADVMGYQRYVVPPDRPPAPRLPEGSRL